MARTAIYGGGMYNGRSSPTLTNVSFSGNFASNLGGGMLDQTGNSTLTNVTFSGNSASFQGGGMNNYNQSNPTIRNSILWGDSGGEIISGVLSTPTVSYSIVQGDYSGTGNLNVDPQFLSAVPAADLRPGPGSPAIDAGDNCVLTANGCNLNHPALTSDLRGFPRLVGSTVDMGAFEVNYGLAATSGSGQSAAPNAAFSHPLQATLTESGQPVSGVQLTFTAPMNGASASLSGGTAMTDANGNASVTATANATPGSYQVTASASGLTSASFSLSNTCPTITLGALPQATAGTPFNAVLQASPASGNYQFSSSDKPAWLGLAANGSLSGTPPATGTFNFTVSVTGFGACQQTIPVSVAVGCTTITLMPTTLPNAEGGTPYSQQLAASPMSGNESFTLSSGALPQGLTLSPTGLLGGTTTQTGVFNFRVGVSSFNGQCSTFRDYQLVVSGCAPITLNPASLSNGTIGAITGTPTTSGTFNFHIAAASGNCSGARDYAVTIACVSVAITTASLPAGTAGNAYSQTIAVSPAAPAGSYAFSLQAGSLPSGLTLNTATGLLGGTPLVTGSFNFTIKATTSTGCAATQSYTLQVNCPGITLSSLPTPTLNSPYNQTVTALPSGGNIGFAVTAGEVPAGLSLNPATGVISGMPTAGGAYNFSITATGFGSCTGMRNYAGTITGGGCPTITLPDLPNGSPGQFYNHSVMASPSGSYSYAVSAGSLPPGLTLYGSFGLLFGYPTSAGTFAFTITATNASNCTGSKQYSVQTGSSAVQPLVFGDFDGDGKADLSVWRGQAGDWLTVNSGNGKLNTEAWGSSAAPYFDVMTPGDYDGDGKMDLAVFRRGTGEWLIKGSRDGSVLTQTHGQTGDIPTLRKLIQ